MANEADTCRKHVVPKLQAAGWDNEPYSITEQRTITDGRIVPRGQGFLRKPPKRVDYLLRYRRDTPLAVVEAKAAHKTAVDGVQQARQYAEFPDPDSLWQRYQTGAGIKPSMTAQLLQPFNHAVGKGERYYQQIAISRIAEAILKGQRRVLGTMATGTGKTAVAFQLCWNQ
jgi:type I restriction enzyme, R subunit